MLITIHHNPQNNQVTLFFEPASPDAAEAAAQLMEHLSQKIRADLAAQQAQTNGQAQQRPSGIIVPPVRIPKNIKGDADGA